MTAAINIQLFPTPWLWVVRVRAAIKDERGLSIADESGNVLVSDVPIPKPIYDENQRTILDEAGNPLDAE